MGRRTGPAKSISQPGHTINASTQATARPPRDRGAPRAISRLTRAALAGTVGLAAAGGVLALAGQAQADGWQDAGGAVYTMTNSAAGNPIETYSDAYGTLTPTGTYPTRGDGGTLDSGHSTVVSGDGQILVNAGSDSVSAFAVTPWGLHLVGTVSSGGTDPDSVTIAGDQLVYVLNASSKSIAGFWLGYRRLRPILGSAQPLGADAPVPKQIQFSNDARELVVDEGGSNTIDTFLIGRNGTAGPTMTTPSVGGAPFGFDFDRADHLLVSDAALTAGQSGVTSYDLGRDGGLSANGPAVPIDQAAACWLAAAATSPSPPTPAVAPSAATASRRTARSPRSAPRWWRTTRARTRSTRASAPASATCTSWLAARIKSSVTGSPPTGRSLR